MPTSALPLRCPQCQGLTDRRHCDSAENRHCDWKRCDPCEVIFDRRGRWMRAPGKAAP